MQTTEDPKSVARERLAARARRITMLRRRVVATSLATFAIAFGAVAATGSTGIGDSSSTTTVASATTKTVAVATTTLAPVTTSQS